MALQNIVDILFGFNPFHKFYLSVFSAVYSNDANFALLYLSETRADPEYIFEDKNTKGVKYLPLKDLLHDL